METEATSPITYFLHLKDEFVKLNDCIGKSLHFSHLGYQCLNCGDDRPIFKQGFCKKCFFESAKAGSWIMKPEESKAHLGIADRDLAYEERMQLQPHIVYLSNTGAIKVGVTRKSQLPTRWIDQGAHEALAIAEVPNRYLAGVAEVALKAHISDKTQWKTMLSQVEKPIDLVQQFNALKAYLPEEVSPYILNSPSVTALHFPYTPEGTLGNRLSLGLDHPIQGVLKGIKGQYLIFDDLSVFNVRSYEGYLVGLDIF
ncbi:MAG: hypothetical protein RLZZ242_1032 [Bacteroidota bacterium]